MRASFDKKSALSLLMLVAFTAACRGPTPPLALSPIGHGGPKQARAPKRALHQQGTPWRAYGLSAPSPQACHADPVTHSIICAVPAPWDHYGEALAEADSSQNGI
jgi:hypothetical protein